MISGKIYRQCSLLRRCCTNIQIEATRPGSWPTNYNAVAPAVKLRQSYIHRPGMAPLVEDTMGTVLDRAAVHFGSQQACVYVHQNIRKTWSEICREADRLAVALMQLGMEKGDRVGIWATNLYEWQLTQYAAAKAGLILVNVNQAYQTHELEYCLKKVGVSTLVAADGYSTSNYYSMLTELLPEPAHGEMNVPLKLRSERLPQLRNIISISKERKRGVLRFDDLLDSAKESGNALRQRLQDMTDCGDACNIQFTSGTTGLPKGATLSHHNIINNMLSVGSRSGMASGNQRHCFPVPLYHSFGCVVGSVQAALFGNTLVFPSETYNAEAAVKAVQDEKCHWLFGTPVMFVDMLSAASLNGYDTSSLWACSTGGAPVAKQLMKDIRSQFGMDAFIGYGLTETGPIISAVFPSDDLEHQFGTVGFPMDHVEVKVMDDSGHIVPVGTPGEVCSRGYNTFLGYWDDEEKTKECLTADRWFRTGDIGVMMEDGYLRIVGRIKEMVIRGGENIYPAEIEHFLDTHPNILEAYVFGVPDERMGEELCVWIHTDRPNALTERDVREFCRGKIAHRKIPRYIQFRDDFPKTVTGKVQKFVMQKMVVNELGLKGKVWES